ncbi:MAG: phosphate starvation-inducible protein PhoH [Bacillales bacterium]|jgi:phosphate starvation-inducible PhoH-like protein|nr:phosphate starvation-inducible protein PhoH [Bacillales bacterium]
MLDIKLQNAEEAIELFGIQDVNLKTLEDELNVNVISRGEIIHVSGSIEDLQKAEEVLQSLLNLIRKGIKIGSREIIYCLNLQEKGTLQHFSDMYEEELYKNAKGKSIRLKTLGQQQYVHAIRQSDLVFGIGPAGTGKTYLAVLLAVIALKANLVKRIILTRPAVEAGESLGFLPGDLKEKVDPYLRPLYDALHDLLGLEYTEKLMERGIIEIAPLAYMRGRTLEDAFVILDEAQNTTPAQMKMFVTRLGFGSKMVITGDKTQIDLPRGAESGLNVVEKILQGVRGVSFVFLDETDVVRHPLVSRIIHAYDQYNKKTE